jgi:hypothetical protein
MPNAKRQKYTSKLQRKARSAKFGCTNDEVFNNAAKLCYPLFAKPSLCKEAGENQGWKDIRR